MSNDMQNTPGVQDKKSEMLALAEAMNNLAAALRENKTVMEAALRAAPPPQDTRELQAALTELAQRVAVLSARLR